MLYGRKRNYDTRSKLKKRIEELKASLKEINDEEKKALITGKIRLIKDTLKNIN